MVARDRAGIFLLTLALCAPAFGDTARPIGSPTGISPGAPEQIMAVDRSCPSFSWSLIAGMGSELVVVELDESTPASHTPDLEPVLHIRLPAGSSSWTPPGRQCLAAGRYAW